VGPDVLFPKPVDPVVTPPSRLTRDAQPNSGLNLLGLVENWGVKPGTKLHKVVLSIETMNGAQLQKMLKDLPDGVKYGLELEQDPPP
jgi:hypothetical protein